MVPGRLLVDLSRLLPDSEVTIELRDDDISGRPRLPASTTTVG